MHGNFCPLFNAVVIKSKATLLVGQKERENIKRAGKEFLIQVGKGEDKKPFRNTGPLLQHSLFAFHRCLCPVYSNYIV